uniref:S-adenosylmethionine sensor upstream of mTORC1 n=1 Tax=Amblyomma maculatum TaxID=34609 RepID=G3MRE7_AMBMU
MTGRQGQQELVAVIRGVHEKLRLDYQTNGDGDQVWRDHCEDVQARKRYAESMFQLATTVWPYKDRIEWCHKTMREYFFEGGLEHVLRRHHRKTGVHCPDSALNEARRNLAVADGRIHLLDVGSCYNPFSAYSDIHAVAIDLTPATEDVIECDFLKLEVVCGNGEDLAESEPRPLKSLPENSFHAVVFCLVLEYLPSCTQRWTFCKKAASLLRPNGLLFIITPDSKHQQRNATMIASWRKALEHIRLLRVRYEKRQHLHCMAFRKHIHQITSIEKEEAFKAVDYEESRAGSREARPFPDVATESREMHNIPCGGTMGTGLEEFSEDCITEYQQPISAIINSSKESGKSTLNSKTAEEILDRERDTDASASDMRASRGHWEQRKCTCIELKANSYKHCHRPVLDITDDGGMRTFFTEDDELAQLMYIPQDSRDYVALFTKNIIDERTSAEDESLKDAFLELPGVQDL